MNELNPTITYEGQDYEVLGSGHVSEWDKSRGTHIMMAVGGTIREIGPDRSNEAAEHCFYLHKIMPKYNFGRLILEETGEVRKVKFGDAYLTDKNIVAFWSVLQTSTVENYRILEVVKIVKYFEENLDAFLS